MDVCSGSPIATLFPSAADRAAVELVLARALEEAMSTVAQGRVAPSFDTVQFATELSRFDFATPIPLANLLPWVVQKMRDGIVQITHPRYFGLFNPAPGFPALCAEQIVAAFNPQLASSTTSPAAIAIEAHVIDQVAHRAGLPTGSAGHFTNGGSEANFTALICALMRRCAAFRENGARAFSGSPTLYVSRDAHLGWIKIAQQAGIGRTAVRLVPTDGQGRMSASALAAAVSDDVKRGAIPVMVVATAGTTVAGMIDPLTECAAIAEDAAAWFHVDAAWGGAALASSRLRPQLVGIDQADSITIDAHKWFATTMSCGMFLTAAPGILRSAFGVVANYMPSASDYADPYMSSVMWSRRFLGLRMFLNLATLGWAGYADHVEHTILQIDILGTELTALGWTVANRSTLGVLCVEPPSGCRSVQLIVRDVVESGEAWVSAAQFEGRDVIRICVTNGRTQQEDLDTLVILLNEFAGKCRSAQ